MQQLNGARLAPSRDAEDQRFTYYTLFGLLPEGDTLALDREMGMLTQLSIRAGPEACVIVEQQRVFSAEIFLLIALLASHPDYCPLEVLLHEHTGKSLEKCRELINMALDEGILDTTIKPLRNVLSRLKMKLHPFGIDLKSIPGTGYLLLPRQRKGKRS